jgi:hypothetical protein
VAGVDLLVECVVREGGSLGPLARQETAAETKHILKSRISERLRIKLCIALVHLTESNKMGIASLLYEAKLIEQIQRIFQSFQFPLGYFDSQLATRRQPRDKRGKLEQL